MEERPNSKCLCWKEFARTGGERGIRTLGTGFSPYNGLANRRLQPLGHLTAHLHVYVTSTYRLRPIKASVCRRKRSRPTVATASIRPALLYVTAQSRASSDPSTAIWSQCSA